MCRVLKAGLRERWEGLAPAVQELLRASGPVTQGLSPTFQDFLWAYSIFWYFPPPHSNTNVCRLPVGLFLIWGDLHSPPPSQPPGVPPAALCSGFLRMFPLGACLMLLSWVDKGIRIHASGSSQMHAKCMHLARTDHAQCFSSSEADCVSCSLQLRWFDRGRGPHNRDVGATACIPNMRLAFVFSIQLDA